MSDYPFDMERINEQRRRDNSIGAHPGPVIPVGSKAPTAHREPGYMWTLREIEAMKTSAREDAISHVVAWLSDPTTEIANGDDLARRIAGRFGGEGR